MADVRRYELEELANRPGTYYNPTTEVVIVVALGRAHRRRLRTRAGAQLAVLADREPAAPDVVIETPAAEQRDDRQDGADPDDHEDDGAEGFLHP